MKAPRTFTSPHSADSSKLPGQNDSPRCRDSPYECCLGVAYEAEQHQEADEDVEEEQAYVAQPPVGTHAVSNLRRSIERQEPAEGAPSLDQAQ